jgi:hypothetical protein
MGLNSKTSIFEAGEPLTPDLTPGERPTNFSNLNFLVFLTSRNHRVVGGVPFPFQSEAVPRGGDFSVRRASVVENVTTRETKRPKEREKDKEYRRRTLTHADSSFPIPIDRAGMQAWPIEGSRASYENVVHGGGSSSPHQSFPSPFEQRTDAVASVRRVATDNGKSSSAHESPGQDQGFEVNLVHAGQTVR